MTLEFLGRRIHFKDVYASVQIRRDGVTAAALIRAAESFGLRATAVRATKETLPSIPRGAILHLRAGHYVVLDSVTPDGTIRVLDPRAGLRTIAGGDTHGVVSGIAIVLRNADARSDHAVTRWNVVRAAAKLAWLRYRNVLPAALMGTAGHVLSLMIAATLIGILGGTRSVLPLFVSCVALAFCEAARTIAITHHCARVRLRRVQSELRAFLRSESDAARRLSPERGLPIDKALTASGEIAERVTNLAHQLTCASGALVVLFLVNPAAWLNTMLVGTAFVVHAARAAIRRYDWGAGLPEREVNEAHALTDLLPTVNVTTKTTTREQEIEQRCATLAVRYEWRNSRFESWSSPHNPMSRAWLFATVIAAVWSIKSDAISADPWTQAAACFALLLSVSTTLSAQGAVAAHVRLIALENKLEYQESAQYVLSREAHRLQSAG
jgi:hypothetical protein